MFRWYEKNYLSFFFYITLYVCVAVFKLLLTKISIVVMDEIMSTGWWKNDNDWGNTK